MPTGTSTATQLDTSRAPSHLDAAEHQAADALARAERACGPTEPISSRWPLFDKAAAYRIQRYNVAQRIGAGDALVGHKVGLTSAAMQRQFGVGEPDFGHLLESMRAPSAGRLAMAELIAPQVEIELAFVLDAPLRGPNATFVDVARATAFVLPAIEVIDSRIENWRVGLVDTIADNASSARVVLGARAIGLDQFDPRLVGGILRINGEIVETGASGAVLGNPMTAVAWLANTLHQFGVHLEAGQVILSGSCTRAVRVQAGDYVLAEFDGLGSVEIAFA